MFDWGESRHMVQWLAKSLCRVAEKPLVTWIEVRKGSSFNK